MRIKWNWNPTTQMELIFEEVMKVGRDVGKAHKSEREKTIATWEGARPAWNYAAIRQFPDKVSMVIAEQGDPFGKKKWMWLDEGTKVRYMHVTADWRSKTRVNRIGSWEGQGQTTGLGFPLPGIKARNWTILINRKLNKRLERRFKTALKKGLKRRRKGKFAGVGIFHG
jgi:hypothetical protein